MRKAFVTKDNMATFVCPQCRKPRRADVSRLSGLNRSIRVRVRCPCGHLYTAELERRKRLRKAVDFPGVAFRMSADGAGARHLMTVTDISPYGLKLRFNREIAACPGDILTVEFRLQDARRRLIRKDVVVLAARGCEVGVKYQTIRADDPNDQALGFFFIDG
jgi:hypothetical protein